MPAFLLYTASELRMTRIQVQALGPPRKRRGLHSLLSLRWGCFPLGFVLKRQRFRPGYPSCVRRGILTLHPSSSSPVSTCHVRKVVVGVSAHQLCPGDTVGDSSLQGHFCRSKVPFLLALLGPLLSWKTCRPNSPLHLCLRMETTRTNALFGPIHGKSDGTGWGQPDASEASSEL